MILYNAIHLYVKSQTHVIYQKIFSLIFILCYFVEFYEENVIRN